MNNFQEKVNFIWSVADLLRGDYKQSEYGKVILPLTVLRRLDCVLEPTKQKVLDKAKALPAKADETMKDMMLCQTAGQTFYNLSRFVFQPTAAVAAKGVASLLGDQEQIAANLKNYVAGFSPNAREIFLDKFKFGEQIDRLDEGNLLFLVVSKFVEIDLHPDVVDNHEMGYVFEELIRRFSEQSNETAGEHFTPREVIRLMVNLLFAEDSALLTKKGVIRTLYDPACGTGGMLSVAENYLRELNPSATLKTYGQELNPESYAICKSDLLIKGEDASHVKFGNSFTQDGLAGEHFDYMLSNPPFGVEWKKVEAFIRGEHEKLGMGGRFGAGLPRVNDGSFLFLQHMLGKFKKNGGGSRLAIVFNGSPLFTGGAGSGESEIRRWIIENDWLEAVVGLPEQLFYNTPIATYVWVVTNRKSPKRKGKVQLIDASSFFVKMRKSLGNKRNEIAEDQIRRITEIYGDFEENEFSKVFDNEDFGYWRVTVERPLRLNFSFTPERIERLKATTAFQNIASSKKKPGKERDAEIEAGRKIQAEILVLLDDMDGKKVYRNRDAFRKVLESAFKGLMKLPTPFWKVMLDALSERDETADICTDAKGDPEPDPELRDYENVPLKEDIQTYFQREVLPHVPDAWIDEQKSKKGYEISFTRHFCKYTVLRPLKEIEGEIAHLGAEIQALISEAITKGHDPHVPMKDSGIEWLGRVPRHWSVERLKWRMRQIEQGWSPQCENRRADPGEWGVLKVGCMNSGNYEESENKALPADLEPLPELEVKVGDILMSRSNTVELVGCVGRVHQTQGKILVCDKLYRLVFDDKRLDPDFAVLLLRSHPARLQIERDASGASASMKNISNEVVAELVLAFPSLDEQRRIVTHVTKGLSELRRMESLIGEQIAKLREYRQTLISAAVTGQIDVTTEGQR